MGGFISGAQGAVDQAFAGLDTAALERSRPSAEPTNNADQTVADNPLVEEFNNAIPDYDTNANGRLDVDELTDFLVNVLNYEPSEASDIAKDLIDLADMDGINSGQELYDLLVAGDHF